ncbi:MAG TPA: hypothetical protein VMB19_02560 [Silvibacterium sp.]|nr:hypothetical protein [Silvibacterium sp.]
MRLTTVVLEPVWTRAQVGIPIGMGGSQVVAATLGVAAVTVEHAAQELACSRAALQAGASEPGWPGAWPPVSQELTLAPVADAEPSGTQWSGWWSAGSQDAFRERTVTRLLDGWSESAGTA